MNKFFFLSNFFLVFKQYLYKLRAERTAWVLCINAHCLNHKLSLSLSGRLYSDLCVSVLVVSGGLSILPVYSDTSLRTRISGSEPSSALHTYREEGEVGYCVIYNTGLMSPKSIHEIQVYIFNYTCSNLLTYEYTINILTNNNFLHFCRNCQNVNNMLQFQKPPPPSLYTLSSLFTYFQRKNKYK